MATGRPDWFGTIVSAGKYNSTFVPIAVDVDGNLLALMKGAYDSVLKTIALDEDGVMLANLSAQDLDFLTVRPAYGQAVREQGLVNITAGNTITLTTISGRGVIYGGWTSITASASRSAMSTIILTDLSTLQSLLPQNTIASNFRAPENLPLFGQYYDDVAFKYIIAIRQGLTFESSFRLNSYNPYGSDQNMSYDIYYALVP